MYTCLLRATVCIGRHNFGCGVGHRVRLYIVPPFTNHRTSLLVIAPHVSHGRLPHMRTSDGHVSDGRVSRRRVPYGRASHLRVFLARRTRVARISVSTPRMV